MSVRPPLNSLHVFCVVVREGGFRQAARALCVTPGAVSRQIKALEENLSQTLLDRGAGGTSTLTRAGSRLHEQVASKMAAVAAVLEGSTRARHSSLLVDTNVTLAMHWLIPQLRAFSERYPRLQVQVRTVEGDIDPTAPVDVFVRRDPSELRGLPAEVFMVEQSILVGAATLPDACGPSASGRLSGLARIGARSRNDLWKRWDEVYGRDLDARPPTLMFDNTVLAIQAAAQGLGACVVPEMFVSTMLVSRTLRRLHPGRIETGTYSFAVGRRRETARAATFTAWLREIARKSASFAEV